MIEYLNRLRVEQSKRLLMFTDDPVMDVAIASGFNSRQHFFRVFQTETGMSPRDFRKNKGDTNVQNVYKFDHAEDYSYDDELNLLRKK